ncbi:hypothetical protein FZI85_27150 [Mycobacterium sp. CBMA293]|uniref:Uncharacterized protein n=1 Tax=Mycolicibacterium sp. CBMA 213 TaxID=1968788 RepID=A0A1S6GKH1_9MYCO|nr:MULTISPECIES: hypothetical protein [unclassified Mycolicibacterium]AQS22365.1 hypothetical protein pCBMA213_2_00001 [Mycolicibacterium sp. CBMA 213]MUL48425.1 hypothetical protein [Mycolicibacterium sp. CBMA 360]MUL62283.1 hypothetical protein [Mycolicibacterium sp. CBMA 335]MUM04419.1 hypothetical protein [Mycolicibacterium sp. CBMA 213]MUM14683.1 hypothetical protein [Mycolicibacterium sp. CBMA 293]
MSALPKPDGWKNRYLLMALSGALTGALFAYFAYKTVRALGETHWLAGVIALCDAVAFGIVTGGLIVLQGGATKLRGRYDETGTTLDAVPAQPWAVVMCVTLALGSGLYLMFGSQVHDDLPTASSRAAGRLIVMVVISIIGAVMIMRNIIKGRPTLILAPEGIAYSFPGDRTFTIVWDDIVDITSAPLTGRGKGWRPIVFECGDGTCQAIASASTWVPGGTRLYWLCRFYWQRPADRGELGTGVALERLAFERIPVA